MPKISNLEICYKTIYDDDDLLNKIGSTSDLRLNMNMEDIEDFIRFKSRLKIVRPNSVSLSNVSVFFSRTQYTADQKPIKKDLTTMFDGTNFFGKLVNHSRSIDKLIDDKFSIFIYFFVKSSSFL